MKVRSLLLLLAVSLLCACSNSGDSSPAPVDQASALAAQLSASHTPANEVFIQLLLDNELGSDPLYLIEYRQLKDDTVETQVLLDNYAEALNEKLASVGAYVGFENTVLRQVSIPDERVWHEVTGIYFPSPQALLDLLQDAGYQQAVQNKYSATLGLHSFLITLLVDELPATEPDKNAFYMANLNQHRERALYADGTDHGLTGREADALYTDRMLAEVLPTIGAYPVLAGEYRHLLLGTDADWDTFALVRYPSLPEFFGMISTPLFQELVVNKGAGLARTSAMMTSFDLL
ncbi:Uncharacterised protein [Halioglobus japonicus]|nr:Uncharacterised protein [Halioglobus japonicus]